MAHLYQQSSSTINPVGRLRNLIAFKFNLSAEEVFEITGRASRISGGVKDPETLSFLINRRLEKPEKNVKVVDLKDRVTANEYFDIFLMETINGWGTAEDRKEREARINSLIRKFDDKPSIQKNLVLHFHRSKMINVLRKFSWGMDEETFVRPETIKEGKDYLVTVPIGVYDIKGFDELGEIRSKTLEFTAREDLPPFKHPSIKPSEIRPVFKCDRTDGLLKTLVENAPDKRFRTEVVYEKEETLRELNKAIDRRVKIDDFLKPIVREEILRNIGIFI